MMSEADRIQIVGKTMAFTSISFKNAQDQVVARGSHTKYVTAYRALPHRC